MNCLPIAVVTCPVAVTLLGREYYMLPGPVAITLPGPVAYNPSILSATGPCKMFIQLCNGIIWPEYAKNLHFWSSKSLYRVVPGRTG